MTAVRQAGIGILVYGLFFLATASYPLEYRSQIVLLMLAPLVLMPLAFTLYARDEFPERAQRLLQFVQRTQPVASLSLAVSFAVDPGKPAAIWSLPWLVTTALVALAAALRLSAGGMRPFDRACRDMGALYLAIGGAWAFADRLGIQPLNFDPSIVRLTAVHFHYAGFLLPVFTGFAMREIPGRAASLAGLAVIAGVPATAIGITISKLVVAPAFELGAALLMVTGGVLSAALHFKLALAVGQSHVVRLLFMLTGVSLTLAMMLATTYAMRYAMRRMVDVTWLSIPWMQVTHGTINAVGFGVAGTLAWWMYQQLSPATRT